MPRFLVYASVAFGWLVGLLFVAFWVWFAKLEAARTDREQRIVDSSEARDKREKAWEQKEQERAAALMPKRGPLPWEMRISLVRSSILWTNVDANETRYVCGVATLTNKKTGVTAKAAEVCSGALPPHTTSTAELVFDTRAIVQTCDGEGSIGESCTLDFVKDER